MSKAFMRESDFEELPELPRASASLPPGVKNLMTAAGAARLGAELRRLTEVERPPLAALVADVPEKRAELAAVDQRISLLRRTLNSAEIVPPDVAESARDVVRFGSTVTVREPDGRLDEFQIVGVDETDSGGRAISWQSPLGKALLGVRVGARASFQAPGGRRELVVLDVR